MDFTHKNSFGKLKFVHFSINTFSGMIFASAYSGEKLKDVKAHCLTAFPYMNVPKCFKQIMGLHILVMDFKNFLLSFYLL